MNNLTVVGLPRVSRAVRCPYCRHDIMAICRKPVDYETLETCGHCLGVFVVRFDVEVKARVLGVDGERDRIADEQEELLELERRRSAAGETS